MKSLHTILLSFLLFAGTFIEVYGHQRNEVFHLIEKEPQLIDLIHKADPSLLYCKDELEIAKKVMTIVHQIITSPYGYTWYTNVDHNSVSPQKYYEKVIRNYEPILCGGKNTFLANILNEYFNIDAFVINFGILSTPMTHVVTVIPIKNTNNFVLFDSHYGCFYTDKKGKFLDLESIFCGSKFYLNFLDFDKIYILDSSINIHPSVLDKITNGMAICIGNISETRSLFLRPSDGLMRTENNFLQTYKECSWRDTCLLQFLATGKLFGINPPQMI